MSDQSSSEVSETNDDLAESMGGMTELQMLKSRATMMGITYSNNIGIESLRAKITAKMEGQAPAPEPDPVPQVNVPVDSVPPKELTKGELRAAQIKKHMRLVRCRIQNLDPKKKDLRGEIFTVANDLLGTVRKFIPYGEVSDGGYHIPYCLYKLLDRRRFVNITVQRDTRTNKETPKMNMAKEFAIEILPPLTAKQLGQLATAQAAAGSVEGQAA